MSTYYDAPHIPKADIEAAVKALRALKKAMNPRAGRGLWIFCASGTVHLMKTHPDGSRHVPGRQASGMDPDLILESFSIPSDGGDW